MHGLVEHLLSVKHCLKELRYNRKQTDLHSGPPELTLQSLNRYTNKQTNTLGGTKKQEDIRQEIGDGE